MIHGLSVCSGVEGLGLGLAEVLPGLRTVAYCEADPFCQAVLCTRMADGWLDRAPIWPDLRTFDGTRWRGLVDLVHGGPPCQGFSVAGKRRGERDPRNLIPDTLRVIRECEPSGVFLENVPGALPYFFHVVLPELQAMGYRVAAGLFRASDVGAPHRRERVFVLAYAAGERCEGLGLHVRPWRSHEAAPETAGGGGSVDHPASPRREERVAATGGPRWAARSPRESGGQRDAVGDTDLAPEDARTETGRSRRAVGESGGSVADAERDGLEGGEQPQSGQGPPADGRRLADEGLPPWPPGPAERDRWAAVLARWPELAPALAEPTREQVGSARQPRLDAARPDATQRALHLLASGAPAWVGRICPWCGTRVRSPRGHLRMHQLRALGNSCIPAQAAYAFVTLVEELTQRRRDG